MSKASIAVAAMLAVAAVPFALATAAAQQSPPAGSADAGDAAHGKQIFMADGCFECHGTVGQGGPGLRLAPGPIPVQSIAVYIRNPSGEMPPYTSKVVSDADVRDIHAYLASIPKPPALADIPELN